MPQSRHLHSASLLALLGALALSFKASADAPAQRFTSEPGRVEAQIGEWPDACGPRPASVVLRAEGVVEIAESAGQLEIRGTRTRRTDRCWSENRNIQKVAASAQGNSWRVVCRTPPAEPRAETSTVTITRLDASISAREETTYDWSVDGNRCRGTLTTTRKYTLLAGPPSTDPVPSPNDEPAGSARCEVTGPPAALRLSPASVEIAPGGRACVQARVVDASGCPVRDAMPPAFSLEKPPGRAGRLDGTCFFAADSSAEAEGTFRIVATAANLRAQATVLVKSQDFSDIRAIRTPNAHGDPNVAGAESTGGAGLRAGSTSPQSSSRGLAIALGLGIVGIIVVALLALRQRRAPEPVTEDDPFESFSPTPPVSPPLAPTTESKICPVCRLGHAGSATVCVRDGTPLVPYSKFTKNRGATNGDKPRICPKCGDRFDEGVAFCGKDGARLERA